MRKASKVSLILIFSTLIMLGLLYIGLAYYYTNVFPYGTFINDVYCTGLTPEEAAKKMNERAVPGDIHVTMPVPYVDRTYTINGADLNISYDYLTPLKQYKSSQDPMLWILNLGADMHDKVVPPEVYLDEEKLSLIIDEWRVERIGAPHTVAIEHGDDGYILHNNKEYIDRDQCYAETIDQIKRGATNILLDKNCIVTPAYTSDEQHILKQFESLDKFGEKRVTLHLKDEDLVLNKDELYSLLSADGSLPDIDDESDSPVFDKETVANGLYDVLSPYNTYNNHDFKTHNGRTVHLTQGTLGNSIDVDEAVDELYDALSEGKDVIDIQPVYKHQMDEKESEYVKDIGNTYIEISLDEQHMYYYENGRLKLDTNVVTGKMSTGSGTKEGVYYIYYMQRNRTLIGETYRSFVNYWMAFNRHVGIHDASWRTQWGEDAYLRAGSHGCVNTPFDAAKELYEYAYVGMPVIVYSYEKSEVKD